MANDPKQQQKASVRQLAEREREETSFVGPNERPRVTGERQRVTGPQPERERVTQKIVQPPKTTGSIPIQKTTGPVPIVGATSGVKEMTGHQKQMLSSAFQDAARFNFAKSCRFSKPAKTSSS